MQNISSHHNGIEENQLQKEKLNVHNYVDIKHHTQATCFKEEITRKIRKCFEITGSKDTTQKV